MLVFHVYQNLFVFNEHFAHNHLPDHALVVDQVQDIFSDLELAVLWKILLQIPAPAAVEHAHEHGTDKVDYHDLNDGEYLRRGNCKNTNKRHHLSMRRNTHVAIKKTNNSWKIAEIEK